MPSPHPKAGRGRRLDILSRTIAAIFGGYALASLCTTACAILLPGARAEAVLTGMLLSFAVYVCAFLWAFAAPSASRAWFGLLLPALFLAGAVLLTLRRGIA